MRARTFVYGCLFMVLSAQHVDAQQIRSFQQVQKLQKKMEAYNNQLEQLLKEVNAGGHKIRQKKVPVGREMNIAPPPPIEIGPQRGNRAKPLVGSRRMLNRFGLRISLPSPTLIDQMELPKDQGLVLTFIDSNSSLAKSGLQQHDILLEINEQAIPNDVNRFAQLLQTLNEIKEVSIVVLRKGTPITIKGIKLP